MGGRRWTRVAIVVLVFGVTPLSATRAFEFRHGERIISIRDVPGFCEISDADISKKLKRNIRSDDKNFYYIGGASVCSGAGSENGDRYLLFFEYKNGQLDDGGQFDVSSKNYLDAVNESFVSPFVNGVKSKNKGADINISSDIYKTKNLNITDFSFDSTSVSGTVSTLCACLYSYSLPGGVVSSFLFGKCDGVDIEKLSRSVVGSITLGKISIDKEYRRPTAIENSASSARHSVYGKAIIGGFTGGFFMVIIIILRVARTIYRKYKRIPF